MITRRELEAVVVQINAEFARLKKRIETLESELEKVKTPNGRKQRARKAAQ